MTVSSSGDFFCWIILSACVGFLELSLDVSFGALSACFCGHLTFDFFRR